MPREKPMPEPCFGFLSTLKSTEHGYFGGYLIISPLGRPLEFHCTSPVLPSRALEILYGPTLEPYLVGEQITCTLLQAAKLTPRLILTDTAGMLAARQQSAAPMALLIRQTGSEDLPLPEAAERHPASIVSMSQLSTVDGRISAGGYELCLPAGFEAESLAVSELAAQLGQQVDLSEPFDRIHDAIREAQRIGSNGQAA